MFKKQYIEILDLKPKFSKEELNVAFKKHMKDEFKSDSQKSKKINNAVILNEAINNLRHYSIKKGENNNVFTNDICNSFGMEYNEVVKMLNKKNNQYDIEETIDIILKKVENKMNNKIYIFLLTIASKDLWCFPVDRLISMYILENDNYSFVSFILTLSKLCNEFKTLDKSFSLEDEYKNYIDSCCNSFLIYLAEKIEIKFICKKLNIEEYILRYKFDYENENFRGSFNEYAESLLDMQVMLNELSLSVEELNLYYSKYKQLGFEKDKFNFLKDYYNVKEECNYLLEVYLSNLVNYYRIKEENRTSSFKNWLQIKNCKNNLNLTSDQIIEIIYKNSDYIGDIKNFIENNSSEKKLSLR